MATGLFPIRIVFSFQLGCELWYKRVLSIVVLLLLTMGCICSLQAGKNSEVCVV